MSIKICHVISNLDVGGAEVSLERLINEYDSSNKYTHFVVSLSTIGKIGLKLRSKGIIVYNLNLSSFLGLPIAFLKLLYLIIKTKPDIIHSWMYHSDLLGGIVGKITRKKIIWSIRCTHVRIGVEVNFRTEILMKLCSILSYSIPDVIVCVSRSAEKEHRKYGYAANKLIVINNGLNINNLSNITLNINEINLFRCSLNIKEDELVIGSIGRFNHYKDYPNFISAATLLIKKYNNLKFIIIGKDLNKINIKFFNLIKNAGIESNFILMGERDDIFKCLNAFDIFCLHSSSEGFPNVLAEAMLMGIPCVTTDVGDASLMVEKYGVVVPINNSVLLADGISKLINLSENNRAVIGNNLRNTIINKYSMNKVKTEYENTYTSLLKIN